MAIEITHEVLKNMAGELDMGMVCFYHKTTGEIESYPDEIKMPGFDEEPWEEVIEKVDENYADYIRIESMDSSEAFKVMEKFVDDISEPATRDRFIDALSYKKPFANFNQLLYNYPELREQWFAYKNESYIEYVKEYLEFKLNQ